MSFLYLLQDLEHPVTGAQKRYSRLVESFKQSNLLYACKSSWPNNWFLKYKIRDMHPFAYRNIFISFSPKKLALLLPKIIFTRGSKIAIIFVRKNIISYSPYIQTSLKEIFFEKTTIFLLNLLKIKFYYHVQSIDDACAIINTSYNSQYCLVTPNNLLNSSQPLPIDLVNTENRLYNLTYIGSEFSKRKNFKIFMDFLLDLPNFQIKDRIISITLVGCYSLRSIQAIKAVLESLDVDLILIEAYNNIIEVYTTNSVLIFSSHADSFPNTLLEWIGQNGLFVASNLFITKLMIDDQYHDILFDSRSVESLSHSLKYVLVRNLGSNNSQAQSALSTYSKSLNFNWEYQILRSIKLAAHLYD